MSEQIFRIVYCSQNVMAGDERRRKEVMERIFELSRANNGRQGVTGALLYNDGFFAQVLEGPQAAIETTFERIQQDERHAQITVLECSAAGSRDFPEWSMAQVQPSSALESMSAGSALSQAMADPAFAAHNVLELLRSLVIQEQ